MHKWKVDLGPEGFQDVEAKYFTVDQVELRFYNTQRWGTPSDTVAVFNWSKVVFFKKVVE